MRLYLTRSVVLNRITEGIGLPFDVVSAAQRAIKDSDSLVLSRKVTRKQVDQPGLSHLINYRIPVVGVDKEDLHDFWSNIHQALLNHHNRPKRRGKKQPTVRDDMISLITVKNGFTLSRVREIRKKEK